MITELEAEEYLNPAALGAGAGALQQPNMQARNVGACRHRRARHHARRAAADPRAHPCRAARRDAAHARRWRRSTAAASSASTHTRGRRIYIDGKHVGMTPIAKPLELAEGAHKIRFEHDWYVPVERARRRSQPDRADAARAMSIDFEKHVALSPARPSP